MSGITTKFIMELLEVMEKHEVAIASRSSGTGDDPQIVFMDTKDLSKRMSTNRTHITGYELLTFLQPVLDKDTVER